MRISDWISDVCSSDLADVERSPRRHRMRHGGGGHADILGMGREAPCVEAQRLLAGQACQLQPPVGNLNEPAVGFPAPGRSEEHTSELQSLMRISYAVFCLNKKIITLLYHTYLVPTY